jgi:hypothetical protein
MPSLCEIDAPGISRIIDRALSEWTPESLRQAFLQYGCTIVRRAASPGLLDQVRAAIDRAYEHTSDVHVYDRDIKAVTDRALTGYEIVGDPKLKRFLDLVYGGQWYLRKNATARRIEGTDRDQGWQEPLPLHLDSQIHRFQFTVNFWVPLQDCGIDSPTLQFVPFDYIRTRGYSGFTGRPLRDKEDFHLAYFSKDAFELEAIHAAFGENCLLRPVMNAGDLIIASNWLIHGSYRTPAMTKGRTSIELRFLGTDLDIAPHLKPFPKRLISVVSGRASTNFARSSSAGMQING